MSSAGNIRGTWVPDAMTPHHAATIRRNARAALKEYRAARAAFLEASKAWRAAAPGARGPFYGRREDTFQAALDARAAWILYAGRAAAIDPAKIIKGAAMSPNAWARHVARHGGS